MLNKGSTAWILLKKENENNHPVREMKGKYCIRLEKGNKN
jgi:hypothetical protein